MGCRRTGGLTGSGGVPAGWCLPRPGPPRRRSGGHRRRGPTGPRCRSEGPHRENWPAFPGLSAFHPKPGKAKGPGAEAPGPASASDCYDSTRVIMDLRGICPYSTSHSTKLSTVSAVMAARKVSTALFLSPRVSRLQVSLDLNILSVAQRTAADADEDEPRAPGSSLHGGAGGAAGGAERRGRLGPGAPVSARPGALRCDALENGPRTRGPLRAVPHGFRSSFRGIELPGHRVSV